MTTIAIEDPSAVRKQQFYARLSGFLLLWLIVTGLSGLIITGRVAGSGPFADKSKRITASERLYRVGVVSELVETTSAALLAFCLYVTLKPVDSTLAQLAMYWRLGEAFIGAAGTAFGFAKLGLYTRPTAQSEALLSFMHDFDFGSYNTSALFFSIGSLLFYCVFLKSTYLPKALSALGIFASVIVTIICFGGLIFPEYSGTLKYGWIPMALAEVVTGIWLMIFGARR